MKTHLTTLVIALFAGYLGGVSGNISFFNSDKEPDNNHSQTNNENRYNPFQTDDDSFQLESDVQALQLKIETLENQLASLQSYQQKIISKNNDITEASADDRKKQNRRNANSGPNKKNLVDAGVNPDIADDMLRRLSQQEFRRLELQNLMQRSSSTERREYSKELRELNKNKISLRSEMGDDTYDQYLYTSGQNNRVKVSSVMAGSPAESSGFQSDDVILYYDNQKVLNWSDVKSATIQGEIGSYTNVEILRDGEQMSLMVPRGTLGVQLDTIQLEPE